MEDIQGYYAKERVEQHPAIAQARYGSAKGGHKGQKGKSKGGKGKGKGKAQRQSKGGKGKPKGGKGKAKPHWQGKGWTQPVAAPKPITFYNGWQCIATNRGEPCMNHSEDSTTSNGVYWCTEHVTSLAKAQQHPEKPNPTYVTFVDVSGCHRTKFGEAHGTPEAYSTLVTSFADCQLMSKGYPPLNAPVEAGFYNPEPPRAWPEGSFRIKRKAHAMHTTDTEWWHQPPSSSESVQQQ
jgi:hypothetical protein